MNLLTRCARALAKLRFHVLGLATIKDVRTERFNRLVEQLLEAGWRKTGEYEGFDAWIDYGRITLRRDWVRLKLEWDNWTEGSVEGPRATIEQIARDHDLPVTHAWRWSDYDEKS